MTIRFSTDAGPLEPEEVSWSPSYGVVERTNCLVIGPRGGSETEITCVFELEG
jgi:hypothetical protein